MSKKIYARATITLNKMRCQLSLIKKGNGNYVWLSSGLHLELPEFSSPAAAKERVLQEYSAPEYELIQTWNHWSNYVAN